MFEVFLMSFCLLSDQLRHKMAFFVIFNITPILWNAISWGWPPNTGFTVHKYTHFQNVASEKLWEIKTPFPLSHARDKTKNNFLLRHLLFFNKKVTTE